MDSVKADEKTGLLDRNGLRTQNSRCAGRMRFAALLVIVILSISPQAVLAAAREDGGATKCGPAPVAIPTPTTIMEHGQARVDDYPWLSNLQDSKVRAYLTAENSYARCHLTALNPLINEIQSELRSRVGQQETDPPFFEAGYLYQSRYDQGANYPRIVRWIPKVHSEEVVLDVPALAASHPYYSLDKWLVSPDGGQVAFAVDLTGARRHHLFVRDIASGKVTEFGIQDAASNLAFSADGQTLFYVRLDPINLRAYQVWRHRQGTGPDVLVYSERDPRAEVSVYQSTSRKSILIKSEREDSTEVSYIPADRPNDEPSVIAKRRDDVRYFVDHVNGHFLIRTNLEAPDYRLMIASEVDPSEWTEIIPNESGKYIREFRAFNDFVAIEQEHDASLSVRVFRLTDLQEIPIPLSTDVAAMSLEPDGNREPESHRVRIRFSRLNQKERSYDFDMASNA
jgi:oligopeptidase B